MKRLSNLFKRGIAALVSLSLVLSQTAWAVEQVVYYHSDALGSPVAATDANGQLLWREAYQPYGQRLRHEDLGTENLWFTGKFEEADVGLVYFGARWYDPVAGRFVEMDPVDVDPANIHTFNRYAYAFNNPYAYVDADGDIPLLLLIPVALKVADFALTAYDTYQAYQEEGATGAARELTLSAATGIVPGGKVLSKAGRAVGKTLAKGGVGPVLKGKEGVDIVRTRLEKAGYAVKGSEITLDTRLGRTRLDLLVKSPEGDQFFLEVKRGNKARLSSRQRKRFPLVESEGAIPRGERALEAGLEPGERVTLPVITTHILD